ncbi:hypothetical protein ACLB2K_040182 [Fragaria x ananassa]
MAALAQGVIVDHIARQSKDIRRLADFYIETFGFEEVESPEVGPLMVIWLVKPSAFTMHLIEFNPSYPPNESNDTAVVADPADNPLCRNSRYCNRVWLMRPDVERTSSLDLKCGRPSVLPPPVPATARLHHTRLQQRPRPLSLPGESVLFQFSGEITQNFKQSRSHWKTGKNRTRRGGKVVGDAAGVLWGGGKPSPAPEGGERTDVRTLSRVRTASHPFRRSSANDVPSLAGGTPNLDLELPLASGLAEYQFAAKIDLV